MSKAICTDPNCDRTGGWRGLCRRHYSKLYNAGLPLPEAPPRNTKHFRTNINLETLRADCSICGLNTPIRIRTGQRRGRIECRPNRGNRVAQRIRSKYGIAYEEYLIMVQAQNGRCLICLERPTERMVVDHDHATGRVRGLLCQPCNFGLGWFRDDPAACQRAARYLKRK